MTLKIIASSQTSKLQYRFASHALTCSKMFLIAFILTRSLQWIEAHNVLMTGAHWSMLKHATRIKSYIIFQIHSRNILLTRKLRNIITEYISYLHYFIWLLFRYVIFGTNLLYLFRSVLNKSFIYSFSFQFPIPYNKYRMKKNVENAQIWIIHQ